MKTCSSGPVPELHHNTDDADDSDNKVQCIDQGDWILASSLLPPCPSEDICASSAISAHLVETFKANLEANAPPIQKNSWMSSPRDPLIPYLNTSNETMLLNWFLEKNMLDYVICHMTMGPIRKSVSGIDLPKHPSM